MRSARYMTNSEKEKEREREACGWYLSREYNNDKRGVRSVRVTILIRDDRPTEGSIS